MIIQISLCGSIMVDVENWAPSTLEDFLDCAKSGNNDEACAFFLSTYQPDFTIIRQDRQTGEFAEVTATEEEMAFVVQTSGCSPVDEVENLPLYIIWFAAHNLREEIKMAFEERKWSPC
jgi:phage major head subunit gpT-like protein